MTIGERISKRRQELGLTVDEVAEQLNKLTYPTYTYRNRRPKEHISPRRHNYYLCKCSKIKPLFCATIQIYQYRDIFYKTP